MTLCSLDCAFDKLPLERSVLATQPFSRSRKSKTTPETRFNCLIWICRQLTNPWVASQTLQRSAPLGPDGCRWEAHASGDRFHPFAAEQVPVNNLTVSIGQTVDGLAAREANPNLLIKQTVIASQCRTVLRRQRGVFGRRAATRNADHGSYRRAADRRSDRPVQRRGPRRGSERKALIFQQRAALGWRFTDCTSKIVIGDLRVGRAISLDSHFPQFGIEVAP